MIPELGIEKGKLAQCPSTPNCVSSQAKNKQHYIEPIVVKGTAAEVKNRLLNVLNQQQGIKIIVDDVNYVRATFTSKVFRFVDDTEFYFPNITLEEITSPDKTSKEIIIHMRSASRVGYSDLGANRKRLERIRSEINYPLERLSKHGLRVDGSPILGNITLKDP